MAAPKPAAATGRIITLEELAAHKEEKDCWISIHGQVYDITKFLSDHPGGPETVLEVAGTDATEQFEDTGHSTSARKMLPKYLIGSLPEGAVRASSGPSKSAAAGGGSGGSYIAYAIPVIILLAALYFQFSKPATP